MNGNCGECERRWYCNIDPAVCEKMTKPVPTNADKIRAMTDMDLIDVVPCPHNICPRTFTNCCECKLDWLKQPAAEEVFNFESEEDNAQD